MCAVLEKGFQDHTKFVQIKLLLPEMLSYYFTYELTSFIKFYLHTFLYNHIRIPTEKRQIGLFCEWDACTCGSHSEAGSGRVIELVTSSWKSFHSWDGKLVLHKDWHCAGNT